MKGMLFGKASLSREGKYPKPTTNGRIWGVTESKALPTGGIATFSVIVRINISSDHLNFLTSSY